MSALENDRKLIRDLATTTRDLGDRVRELADGVEKIAERAVEKVLERRHEKRRAEWKYRAGWAAAGCSVLGFLVQHGHLL